MKSSLMTSPEVLYGWDRLVCPYRTSATLVLLTLLCTLPSQA